MNDDLIQEWFSRYQITVLDVFTVAMILTEKGSIHDKLTVAKTLYQVVIDRLEMDGKVDSDEATDLIEKFKGLDEMGIINQYATLICVVTNQPNLINNDKWIPYNTIGEIKNGCFPCRSIFNRK